jgi:hypothetical protein
MSYKVFLSLLIVLVALFGCDPNAEKPSGRYQSTSYNTGKKVLLDFNENGDVLVQVSHVNVSDKKVDDAFFPFFNDGKQKYRWKMADDGRFVGIHNETGFEIVKLEYKGKYLSWDKTRFTRE